MEHTHTETEIDFDHHPAAKSRNLASAAVKHL